VTRAGRWPALANEPGLPGAQPAGLRHMKIEELAAVLAALGCPAEKCNLMAAQLDKRARQLAEEKQRSYDEALAHLLGLMRQGWAAKEKGL
jgi:hypothetical protein